MNIHGYMIDVELEGDTLTVTGTTAAARTALRGQQRNDGPLVITRDQMSDVAFKDASAMVNGRITIKTTDGSTHVLHFRKKTRDDFRALAAELGAI